MWMVRLLLLFVGILVVNFQLALRQGEFAAPISISLERMSEKDVADARLVLIDIFDSRQVIVPTGPGSWDCPPRCTAEVLLQFPEAMPANDGVVKVKIGDESFTCPFAKLESLGGIYWLPERMNLGPAPTFALCRNWPGREAFLHYYLTQAAPGLLFTLMLGLLVGIGMRSSVRGQFMALLALAETASSAANVSISWDRFWNLVGWISLIVGFMYLEWMQPYYFTQDDVLIGELPAALLGCRSLWDGVFPDWNPYVLLGAPLATMGFWGMTYPPQLLAYAIARHLLGNELATMEVLAAMHLLVGFVAMRLLCRRLGMGAFTANMASLALVFAGCILIMGRSWHYFVANAVWLPLLGLAIQRFREGPVGWKWIVGVGVVFGLAYHAGFPQIVAILGMFFVVGLAAVGFADRIPLRRTLAVVPALLLGIGLAAPLLLHHLQMTGGHERFVPVEKGVYSELQGALLPYPLAQADMPTHWGSFDIEKLGHFYFFGGLFAVLFALQAFAFWVCWPDRRAWARAWWVPCGIVALLLVLGEPAYLWKGMAELPLAKFFLRYSFRFYPWLAFCAILSGGLILDRVLMLARSRIMELAIGAVMLGILAYHLTMCQPSFYTYGFGPYPELPREFEAVFHPYADKQFVGVKNSRRIASWAQLRSVSPDYYLSLPLNLPHYYQVPSISGYDPIIEGQPRIAEFNRRLRDDPAAACKAYGVGWHLISYSDSPVLSPNPNFWKMEKEVNAEVAYGRLPKSELQPLAESNGTVLMELPGVDPLAFVSDQPGRPLPMQLSCRGADIDVTELAAHTAVTINFLWLPHMRITLDGQALPIEADEWQRMTTNLPLTGSVLSLRYEPPWRETCALGAALCALALALAWLSQRFRERLA